jgi:hypothetical protein
VRSFVDNVIRGTKEGNVCPRGQYCSREDGDYENK